MKKFLTILMVLTIILMPIFASGASDSDSADNIIVEKQQSIYQDVLPVPLYDYSIPRDVFIQIYDVVTAKAYMTYSIITSMTGNVIYHGDSVGYALPADMQLTNPVKPLSYSSYQSSIIEQAEPNGLYSSKNTDGTWVLFVQENGAVTPVYTEMKVTTFPYKVKQIENGIWVRADNKDVEFVIDLD